MTDLAVGQVAMMIEVVPSAAAQAKAGRIKPFAVSTARCAPDRPDLQTVA